MEKVPPLYDEPLLAEIRAAKSALRRDMAARAVAFPASERLAESGVFAAAILESAVWRAARTVLLYAALPTEVSTTGLLIAAAAVGKTAAFPKVADGELVFQRVDAASGAWELGPFGIWEPAASQEVIDPETCAGPILIIVPGLAFDRGGGRLGRGKGYYDRFLRKLRAARSDVRAVGAAFSFQIVDRVPQDDNDAVLDAVAVVVAGAGELLSARGIDIFVDMEER